MMMIRALGGFAVVCSLWALGCSGSDSGGSDAATQCNHLGESVCQANANCAVETTAITEAQRSEYTSNCITGFKGSIDCSRGRPRGTRTCESRTSRAHRARSSTRRLVSPSRQAASTSSSSSSAPPRGPQTWATAHAEASRGFRMRPGT